MTTPTPDQITEADVDIPSPDPAFTITAHPDHTLTLTCSECGPIWPHTDLDQLLTDLQAHRTHHDHEHNPANN